MSRFLVNLLRRLDTLRLRRRIERGLALHLRGEARRDGLQLKNLSLRLDIEWRARDLHPWDRHESPEKRAKLLVRQSLVDAEAAVTRLFQAAPGIDAIHLTVREYDSDRVIMAGIVHRSAVDTDAGLSIGMRLWRRGIEFHSDGLSFEPLA